MKTMRKIIDTSSKREASWREVEVGRMDSGSRRGEKSEEGGVESGKANVEGWVGRVHIHLVDGGCTFPDR